MILEYNIEELLEEVGGDYETLADLYITSLKNSGVSEGRSVFTNGVKNGDINIKRWLRVKLLKFGLPYEEVEFPEPNIQEIENVAFAIKIGH